MAKPKLRFPEFTDEWNEKTLDKLFEYKNGDSLENSLDENGNYYLISLNSIDKNGNLQNKLKRVINAKWFLKKNDIVMVLSDIGKGNFLGLSEIIPEDNKYVLNQRMGLLRAKAEINITYARAYINFSQKYFKSCGQGSAQLNISKGDVLRFVLKIPCIKEQQKIADCLSAMDRKIEAEKKILKDWKELKKALLQQMFVDGIYNDGLINDVYKNFYPGLNTYLNKFKNIFTTNYDYNLENSLGSTDKVCHLHGEFGKLSSEYNVTSLYYATHKTECDVLISKKVPNMEHIYSDAIMSWSWLEKYGEMIEPDTKNKEILFKSISGQLEIVGLAPANDEHLFLLINTNPKIKSVIYYYLKDEDRIELPHHLRKPVTYKKVTKLWNSMK